MISTLSLDTILSDPMLLVGTVCVLIGPVIFLVALVQWIRLRRSETGQFVIPDEPADEPEPLMPSPVPMRPPAEPEPAEPSPAAEAPAPMVPEPPPAPRATRPPEPDDSDRTIVMAPGVSDMQAQLSIAIAQIKTLNKKVYELESQISSVAAKGADALSYNELKEPPMNPSEFTQKLLKLAEHVIVLEKEVARLRSEGRGGEPAPAAPASVPEIPPASKPPIMPL